MGLLDDLVSGVTKSVFAEIETRALPTVMARTLGTTDLGGIGGLLQALQQGGLDRQVASWLGNGANLPVTADQLRAALGDQHLQQIARTLGLPVDDVLAMLAKSLPQTIDTMSPNGTLRQG